jgi:hypothetical protein
MCLRTGCRLRNARLNADNAKELLALADDYAAGLQKMIESGYEEFGPRVQRYHRLIIDALRLSARQQASAEEVAQAIFDGAPAHLWVAVTRPIARALLAKYDIFEKVEG